MKTFVFLCIIIVSPVAGAANFIEITENVVLGNSEEDANQQVVQKVSEKYIIEMIGEDKYTKNRKAIADKVIRDSGKYIPYLKSNPAVKDKDGKTTVAVNVRISTQSLMDLLSLNGFMNSEFTSALVYPMVQVIDRVHPKSFKWWIDSTKDEFLLKTHGTVIQELQNSLKEGNFFVVDPVKWNLLASVPENLRKDYYRRDDVIALGEYFQAPMIIQGAVEFAPSTRTSQNYWVKIKLSAYLASQGKVVVESVRQKETEPGDFMIVAPKMAQVLFKEIFEDFGSQIAEAWKKGTLSSNSLQLTVLGPLSYQGQEVFKKALMQSSSKLRAMTEVAVEQNKRVFVLDYTGTPEELGQKIQGIRVAGLQVKLKDVSWKEVAVRVDEK